MVTQSNMEHNVQFVVNVPDNSSHIPSPPNRREVCEKYERILSDVKKQSAGYGPKWTSAERDEQ